MLLTVEPFDDSTEGTLLSVWEVGGKHRVVRPPCLPHYWSEVEQGDSCLTVRKRLLSNPSLLQQLYRVDFPALAVLDRYRLPSAWESHKRFVDVLASEYGFACPSGTPRVLAWDVESFTFSQVAPDWRRDTLRSVAVHGVWAGSPETVKVGDGIYQYDPTTREFGLCWRVDSDHDEESVVKDFITFVHGFDPDVLTGFNDGGYDLRLLMQRCGYLRVPCRLGRDGSPPYIMDRTYERRGKQRELSIARIRGRVHLDVWLEVMLDQTLFDLKGRGQVEVAKHFGFKPIEDVNHANITAEQLADVNLDDARCCYGLAQLYLRNLYALCEELSIPLNLMVERSPSHIPNWFYGQEFSKLGIISDGYNCERFESIFARGSKPYQGAFVKCFLTGLFRNVEHIDYESFYPSIMIKYNLSGETVSLVEMKPYTGEYRFEEHEGYMIIEVPDVPKVKGKPDYDRAFQFVCRIDTSKDSVTKIKLLTFRARREELKRQYKETKDEKLMSQQYALKVIQNTLYGYHGTPYALYGNILVAILITALGRYHIQELIHKLQKQGKQIIEADSDGLYAIH